MRYAREDKALSIIWLLRRQQDHIIRASECLAQVQLDVLPSRRRGTAVLVSTGPDGDGNSLCFRVLESKLDVFLVLGLDDESWIHVMVDSVSA